jgi:putative transcriptional regulator
MTEVDIRDAAESDPDAKPWTATQLRDARRVPRVKALRVALELTQEQFSERFGIPVGTLRDWEQGKSEPDQTAKAHDRLRNHKP